MPADSERAAHVGVAATCRNVRLGGGGPDPGEDRGDGKPYLYGEIGRLVESPLTPAGAVERHGHDEVGPVEHARAAIAHQRRQRPRERATAIVFQRLDDRSQRPVVDPNRPRPDDDLGPASAAAAPGQRQADTVPGRQRMAAHIARRESHRRDRCPTRRANGASCGVLECAATRGTLGREEESKGRVGKGQQPRGVLSDHPLPFGVGVGLAVSLVQPTSICSALPHKRSRP